MALEISCSIEGWVDVDTCFDKTAGAGLEKLVPVMIIASGSSAVYNGLGGLGIFVPSLGELGRSAWSSGLSFAGLA